VFPPPIPRACNFKSAGLFAMAMLMIAHGSVLAQQPEAAAGPTAPQQPVTTASLRSPHADTPPVSITLAEAQKRALRIEPSLLAARAAYASSKYDRTIARSALLPQLSLVNSYLFTQSNGKDFGGTLPNESGPVFIANNAVHEYVNQFQATETVGLAQAAHYRATHALQLQAEAEQDIAERGLYATVTQFYYSVEAADAKLKAARDAEQEAQRFVDLTQKLERGGEVAHADVLKAELQLEQRQRDRGDAALAALQAHESLGVLLFPDPATPYVLTDPLRSTATLPSMQEIQKLANYKNPELQSAAAGLQAANSDVLSAKAAYLPSLTLAYNYGIDAPRFARFGNAGERFLGYSAEAGLNIPVWDWFATHAKVKQSEIRQDLAQKTLTLAQRNLIAKIDTASNELKTAAAAFLSLNKSVDQARQSLHLSTLRYQAGEATILEVVDAQNTYLSTETADADAAVRYHVALANLERLTGKLP
jgi:outer membrane protein TolC